MRRSGLLILSFIVAGCNHVSAPGKKPPGVIEAPPPTKTARIGWMSRGNPVPAVADMDAFRQGMRELGYVEGVTYEIEPRYARGDLSVLPEHAAELERSGVDVIVAGPFDALVAAKRSTSRVPIIMTPSVDPVAAGIVERLNRPGGTITGLTEMTPELTPKRLALLKQIVPALKQVAILWKPGTLTETTFGRMLIETQDTARALGVELRVIPVTKVEDFDAAFWDIHEAGIDGLIVLINPMFNAERQRIITHASQKRLAAIYEWKSWVRSGGLISFGADVQDVYRRAAGFVDRVLKGANPAELPVEAPIKVELAVNWRTAEALGLTIPDSIIKRSIEVIR